MRQLSEEHRLLLNNEDNARVFLAATGEDIESLRPEYDYEAVQQELARIEEKIRKVEHAVNVFNSTTTVEGMTIDEILVYLPQLRDRKNKLSRMIGRMPKQRAMSSVLSRYSGQTPIIDYEYANYDIRKAEADYRAVSEEIARLQTKLDAVNSTRTFELNI
jgi:septal ring factor EnvC (AmiA/AmiB activator)